MIINGNALNIPLRDKSVQMCVTSPPYYGLRDYGTAKWEGGDADCDHLAPPGGGHGDKSPIGSGARDIEIMSNQHYRNTCKKCGAVRIDDQIGLEESPEQYVEKLVQVFREVKRVLKDDGVLWLNLGDSYASSPAGNKTPSGFQQKSKAGQTGALAQFSETATKKNFGECKPKDLLGIPWMVAFALRADGWYLRSDIIWHKPNPMPESVRDRPTKSHEHIFLLSKSQRYFYDADAIRESLAKSTLNDIRIDCMSSRPNKKAHELVKNGTHGSGGIGDPTKRRSELINLAGRNKRDVWTVTTKPYKGAHFATFPPDLIEPCILAGSAIGDIVIDPFSGSGTACQVAIKHNRECVGIDLSWEYIELTKKRLGAVQAVLI